MSNASDDHDVNDITCLEAFDYLYAYLNDEIKNPVELKNIQHHLSHCKSCFSRAQIERELNDRLKQAGKNELPKSLENRLHKIFDDL